MINLDSAIVYDIETIVNCFTLNVQPLHGDWSATFEISQYRDDRALLQQWFEHWRANQTPMIGYNNVAFDYPVLHFIWQNPGAAYWDIYDKAQEQIKGLAQFKSVRHWECFAPQIDLYKLWHFDNRAKATSLKTLQVNMRSETVLEMPIEHDEPVEKRDVDHVLIPYNKHDVAETKKFALISLEAIKFRIELSEMLEGDVLNWNDTKIGEKLLEQRLGEELCYTRDNGYRQPRQTIRQQIALADIIFPYIRFTNPEFNRVLDYMRAQVLRGEEFLIGDEVEYSGKIETKGVFKGLAARVGGLDFHFGTGGIHGSIDAAVIVATDDVMIRDIDVASLYPSIAIVNRLFPEHLGQKFVEVYAELPKERAKYKKGTPRSNAFKLAGNGAYGKSNSMFSFLFDPQFTMSITINGQLMLCMLAEWLLTVPSVELIQINTDGITYKIRRDQLARAKEIEAAWQSYTRLVLEDAEYSRMWIRDVNNYIAESTAGKMKLKGAYWYPKNFPDDITNASPPAWHKDFSNIVSTMAAVEHMTKGTDIATFIHEHGEKFHFMLRAKVDRSYKLFIGETETQRIMRYYVAREGGPLRKVMPPKGPAGAWKRKNGISDHEYYSVLNTLAPGEWSPLIHTKNKSKFEQRETAIQSGWLVADCSRASDFDWNNVNYEFYIREAEKLVVK